MTKIFIVSDTHGDLSRAAEALRQEEPVDYIFHLGDNVRDAAHLTGTGLVISVLGNCDFGGASLSERISIGGKSLLLTHGHSQGVKYGLNRLAYFAQEREADAVFFGHTHIPVIEYYNGILLMNPGSISLPRSGKPTYGIVEIEGGFITPYLKTVSP